MKRRVRGSSAAGTVADKEIIDLKTERAKRDKTVAAPKEKFKIGGFDVPFCMLVIIISTIGLIMLFSSSYSASYYKYDGDALYFIWRQTLFAIAGIAAMLVIANVPYKIYHKLAAPVLIAAIILLVLVLVPKIGKEFNGARRWLQIGSLPTFQPSELAKAAVIISFSSFAVSFGAKKMHTFVYGILPFLTVLAMMSALLMKEPHLSATIIIMITGIVIIFLGGAHFPKLLALGAAGAGAFSWLVFGMGYGMDRIRIWQDPYLDPLDKGFQILQSLYAIGTGGLWGVGLGQSRQKHLFIPEPYNDFIFSIVCEELGFIGAVIIIILFAALVIRGYYIALRAKDAFGTLLTAGITTQIALQTFLNIAVVSGLIPVTGVSLPFFSSGGTSLLLLFAEMGIVLSVSKQMPPRLRTSSVKKRKPNTDEDETSKGEDR